MARRQKALPRPDVLTLVVQGMLLAYVLLDVGLSPEVASFVNSPVGMAVVAVLALSAFAAIGPVTGVLALVATYVLFEKASKQRRGTEFTIDRATYDQELRENSREDGTTLEERVVSEMAPTTGALPHGKAEYVPTLSSQNGLGSPLA